MIKYGVFAFCANTNTLYGPADYYRTRGDSVVDNVLAGKHAGARVRLGGEKFDFTNPRHITAMLEALQIDFANWKGVRELCQ